MYNIVDNRKYPRIKLVGQLYYSKENEASPTEAKTKDISSGGIAFFVNELLTVGSALNVHVIPGSPVTQPLSADIEIVRVERVGDSDAFEIAGKITKMH